MENNEIKSTHTWVPELCKDQKNADGSDAPAEYSGSVTIRMPDYEEKLDLYADVQDMPKKTPEEKKKFGAALLRVAARKVPDFLVEVSIVRKSDGYLIDSFAKMKYDSDMHNVITEAANKLIGRFHVGND